jgi:hypothetical protein
MEYNVFLDGDRIGYHKVTIKPEASRKIVDTEASFKVKFLMFNAYQYLHTAKEEWVNGCLKKIQTSTDDNGEKLFVKGRLENDQFRIKSPGGEKTIRGCVKTYAYWNPQILQASYLLNGQNGQYVPVEIISFGDEKLTLGQKVVNSNRYRIVNDEFEIDVWYSPDQEWLALSTVTESGATLRYERR